MAETCFVMMPIRERGSDEHEHFRALYETVIKPAVTEVGFEALRADEVAKPGAINAQVIRHIAESMLVIADLTDLNPNVFYELGVRHSLRGFGTVMIVDKQRTAKLPFDLQSYRAIQFEPDLRGVETLRREIQRSARECVREAADARPSADSPVHDCLAELPSNLVSAASGSAEGDLRKRIAALESQVRQYQTKYGDDTQHTGDGAIKLLATIEDTLARAQRGQLVSDLVQRAEAAAASQDAEGYLEALHQIASSPDRSSPSSLIKLVGASSRLGLTEITMALHERARELSPNDDRLHRMQLASMCHSDDPDLRQRARIEWLELLSIDIDSDSDDITLNAQLARDDILDIAMLLDGFHRDGMHVEALRLTTALLEMFPDDSVVQRNHARALERNSMLEEALRYYMLAIEGDRPSVRDQGKTSAIWLGNHLSIKDRTVDAVEAYLVACIWDPDDADGFANVAQDMADLLNPSIFGSADARAVPEIVSLDLVHQMLIAAFSCSNFDQDDFDRAARTVRATESGDDLLPMLLEMRKSGGLVGAFRPLVRAERHHLACEVYEQFRGPLTENAATPASLAESRNLSGATGSGPKTPPAAPGNGTGWTVPPD